MAKVSVITGYYNRAHVLTRTIDSILNQSFLDFELIVFDDASTDGTAEQLEEIARDRSDKRLRVIVHKQNLGFVSGLKNAIDASTGEYIAIQGSGDVSSIDRLSMQVEYLDKNPDVAAVGSWYRNIAADGSGMQTVHRPDANDVTVQDLRCANVFTHGEVMIRRRAYDHVGGYRSAFKFAQDRDLWLRLREHFSLATVPVVLYDRYIELDGVSFSPSKILRQRLFSAAAVRLSEMSERQEVLAYEKMSEKGPECLVSLSDPAVQAPLFRMSLNLALVHSVEAAHSLASQGITSRSRRVTANILVGIYGSFLFRPLRPFVQKIAKRRLER